MQEFNLFESDNDPEKLLNKAEVDRVVSRAVWGDIENPSDTGLARALVHAITEIMRTTTPQLPQDKIEPVIKKLISQNSQYLLLFAKTRYEDEWSAICENQTDRTFTSAGVLQDAARARVPELIERFLTRIHKKQSAISDSVLVHYFDGLFRTQANLNQYTQSLVDVVAEVRDQAPLQVQEFAQIFATEISKEKMGEMISFVLEVVWEGSDRVPASNILITQTVEELGRTEGIAVNQLQVRKKMIAFIESSLREEVESYILGKHQADIAEYMDDKAAGELSAMQEHAFFITLHQSIIELFQNESPTRQELMQPLLELMHKEHAVAEKVEKYKSQFESATQRNPFSQN